MARRRAREARAAAEAEAAADAAPALPAAAVAPAALAPAVPAWAPEEAAAQEAAKPAIPPAATEVTDRQAGGAAARREAPAAAEGPIRGAAPKVQPRYAALRAEGRFECFDGGGSFDAFAVVNDEYCDCPYGSDEPGTSACSGGPAGAEGLRFACGWARAEGGAAPAWASALVRAAAVNDGICDCCGGEDEWDGVIACADRCDELRAAEAVEASKALAGSRAREKLMKNVPKARAKAKYDGVDGGPDGVFLAAADKGCDVLDDGDFKYEVCLFVDVHQTDKRNSHRFLLGRKGEWHSTLWEDGETYRKDYSRLIMDDGEFCAPVHAPRRAEVLFECGAEQKIVKVQEAQVCVYNVVLRTPAACRPLEDHHDV